MIAIDLIAREKFHHPRSSNELIVLSLVTSFGRFNSSRSRTSPNANALRIFVPDSDPEIYIINYICIPKNLLTSQIAD